MFPALVVREDEIVGLDLIVDEIGDMAYSLDDDEPLLFRLVWRFQSMERFKQRVIC
jgi:hypothetical protein